MRMCLVCVFFMLAMRSLLRANEVVGPLVGSVSSSTVQMLYRPSAKSQTLRLRVFDANDPNLLVNTAKVLIEGEVVENYSKLTRVN